MAIFTGWTLIFAVFSKKAWCTHLITFGAIPASLAGNTASFCHLAWLLSLTVATSARRGDLVHHTGKYANPNGLMPSLLFSAMQPYVLVLSCRKVQAKIILRMQMQVLLLVPAVLPVEPSRTRLSAEFAPVTWFAGAGAIGLVAFPVHTLTVAFTVWAPQTVAALASAGELLAWWVVAGTLGTAVTPIPPRRADATACALVTHWV